MEDIARQVTSYPISTRNSLLNKEKEFSTVAPKEALSEDPLVEYEISA
ncbi:hypothetical protein [Halomontanus rarus]|nr:hypothetical protein [Halovivax sp. TS33]